MALRDAFVWHFVGSLNPRLRAQLLWRAAQRSGDRAALVVDALVAQGDRVLDFGANFGMFTYHLSSFVGPTGVVHAFEPHPSQQPWLERLQRSAGNVAWHAVALSDHQGEAQLRVPRRNDAPDLFWATLEYCAFADESHETLTVPLETLASALFARSRRIAFAKIDVEVHELAVLHGGADLLRRDQPSLLIEIEQRHQQRDTTFDYLSELGYEGFALRPETLVPLAEFDLNHDQLAHLRDDPTNLLSGYVNDFLFVSCQNEFAPTPAAPDVCMRPPTDTRS